MVLKSKKKTRICKSCGEEFRKSKWFRVYCTKECAAQGVRRRSIEFFARMNGKVKK